MESKFALEMRSVRVVRSDVVDVAIIELEDVNTDGIGTLIFFYLGDHYFLVQRKIIKFV